MIRKKRKPPVDLKYGLLVDTKNRTHQPTIFRPDNRLDWFESKDGIGSLYLRFSVADFGNSTFMLFGSSRSNGAAILIEKGTNRIRYKNTNGALTTETVFTASLQVGDTYDLAFIKVGETCRAYLKTVALPIFSTVTSGLDRVTITPYTFGDEVFENEIFTIHDLRIFSSEIDRWGGSPDTSEIDIMCKEGNYTPERRYADVVAHYPLQGTGSILCMDRVEQYSATWKNNHMFLVRYDDAELGNTTGISTIRKDIFTQQTATIWQVDGFGTVVYTNGLRTDLATGFPEIKNALNIAGKALTYPAGTVHLRLPDLPTFNCISYKVKVGEVLTKREELQLRANNQFTNPTPDIAAKLESFWNHNGAYDNAGTLSVKDLIGTTHVPLAGYSANELNPVHVEYAFLPIERVAVKGLLYTKQVTANIVANGAVVTKSLGTNGWDNSGSTFDRYVNSGDAVLTAVNHVLADRFIGFKTFSNANGNFGDFSYGLQITNNTVTMWGDTGGLVPVTIPNVGLFTLEIKSGVCKVYCNHALIYTYTKAVTGIQYVQTAFRDLGGRFSYVTLTGTDIRKL